MRLGLAFALEWVEEGMLSRDGKEVNGSGGICGRDAAGSQVRLNICVLLLAVAERLATR